MSFFCDLFWDNRKKILQLFYSDCVERLEKKMDKRLQEKLFKNSVDMNSLTDKAKSIVESFKDIGKPEQVTIEIRSVNEFKDKSFTDVVNYIDRENIGENSEFLFDFLKIFEHGDYYLIIKVKV